MKSLPADIRYRVPPHEASMFVLQLLFDELANVLDKSPKSLSDVAKKFVKDTIDKFILREENFAKYNEKALREGMEHAKQLAAAAVIDESEENDEFGEFDHGEYSYEGFDFDESFESNIEGSQDM